MACDIIYTERGEKVKKSRDDILGQNLSEEASETEAIYTIWLLFREKPDAPPPAAAIAEKLRERFGEVDVVSGSPGLSAFALRSHVVTYEDNKEIPSMVIIGECEETVEPHGDEIARTQFWDCPDGVALLDSCEYQIMIGDFLASGLPALERANILADWLDIALEIYPTCAAVYVGASAKLLTAGKVFSNPYSGSLRLIWFGVNVRYFNVQGTNDRLVDTLGLYAIGLPDVQYHFHTLDPNGVVEHAYNTATYQLKSNAAIKSGHTIEGLSPGSSWRCRYEASLIQPARIVLDIDTGEFSSGNRR